MVSDSWLEQFTDDVTKLTADETDQIARFIFANATAHDTRAAIINLRAICDKLAKLHR